MEQNKRLKVYALLHDEPSFITGKYRLVIESRKL